jgi:hypothetical protein
VVCIVSKQQVTDVEIAIVNIADSLGELRCLTRLHVHCVTLDDCDCFDDETCAVPLVKRATTLRALSVRPSDSDDVHVGNHDTSDLTSCLPMLTYLDLNSNDINSTGTCGLTGLRNLAHLDLSYNDICDAGAAALTCLTALTELCLSTNRIGTLGVKALASLTDLVYLDVSDNVEIDDEGALALAGTTHLTTLCVSRQGFKEHGTAALMATLRGELPYLYGIGNMLYGRINYDLGPW